MDAQVSSPSRPTLSHSAMTWCKWGALLWIGLAILGSSFALDRWPVTATATALFFWLLVHHRATSIASGDLVSSPPPACPPILRWWPPLLAAAAAFWVVEPLMLLVALSLLAVHGLQASSPRWFSAIFGIGLLLIWPPGMWIDGSASYDATAVTLVSQGLDLFQIPHVPLHREIRWGEGEYPINRYLVPGDGLGVVLACAILIPWLLQRSLLHTALLTLSAIPLGWFAELGVDYPIFFVYGSEPSNLQVVQASWIASAIRFLLLLPLLLIADRLLQALFEPIDVHQLDAPMPHAAMELNRWIAWPNVDRSSDPFNPLGGDQRLQEALAADQARSYQSNTFAAWAWSAAGVLSLLAAGLLLTERIIIFRVAQSNRSAASDTERWSAAIDATGIDVVAPDQANPLLELKQTPDWIGRKSTSAGTIWIGTRRAISQQSLWEDQPSGRNWIRQAQRWKRGGSNELQDRSQSPGTPVHLVDGAWKQTSYRGIIEGYRSIWTSIQSSDGNWRNPYRDLEIAGSIAGRISHHLWTRWANLWSDRNGVQNIQMVVDSVTPWTPVQLEQLDEVFVKLRSELFSPSGTGEPSDASWPPSVDAPAMLPRNANHEP
jgi:hypothetical protein